MTVRNRPKPTDAGIDPYSFYIDRNSADNVLPVRYAAMLKPIFSGWRWKVRDPTSELACATVYNRAAGEIVRGLAA